MTRSLLICEEHPERSAGGIALRNRAAAAALAALGEAVVVGVGDPAGELPVSPLGEARAVGLGRPARVPDGWFADGGHPSDGRFDAAALEQLRALLAQVRPDVVVVEQLWLHAALPLAREAGARTVLDAHNVEADVYAAVASAGGSAEDAAMAERTAALEARVVAEVDHVWACSAADASALGAHAVVVPNAVDVAATPLRDPGRAERLLLYPASFAYPPNVRAARVLVEQVLPALPGHRLALVGHSPPRWMRERAASDVLVPGRVGSVRPWLERAAAVVVPLTEGGGTRFKVLEAMAAGVPVVSTRKGVEGLDVVDGEHVLLAEDGAAAASAVRRLEREPGLAASLVASGRALVERSYSFAAVEVAVRRALGRG